MRSSEICDLIWEAWGVCQPTHLYQLLQLTVRQDNSSSARYCSFRERVETSASLPLKVSRQVAKEFAGRPHVWATFQAGELRACPALHLKSASGTMTVTATTMHLTSHSQDLQCLSLLVSISWRTTWSLKLSKASCWGLSSCRWLLSRTKSMTIAHLHLEHACVYPWPMMETGFWHLV